MIRTAGLTALTLLVGLGGCASVRSARDRIVRPAPVCQDAVVPIYFAPGDAELGPEGRRVIAAAAARARGCVVNSVSVMGLADSEGDPAANLALSKRRAQSVSAALAEARLPAAEFDVAAAGLVGAVNRKGQAVPVRRRAEVTLRLSSPK